MTSIEIGSSSYEFEGVSDDDVYLASLQHDPDRRFERFCHTLFEGDTAGDDSARSDGPVLVDAGANIGVTAAIMAHHCPGAELHAIEAGPGVYEVLRRNLLRNGLGAVRTWNLALGDHDGRVQFHESSAFGHIVGEATDETRTTSSTVGPPSVTVPLRSLDSLVLEMGPAGSPLSRLDLIKIDVEGAEPAVLAGMRTVVERYAPLVWMELNTWSLLSTGQRPIEAVAETVDGFAEVFRVGGTADDPRLLRPVTVGDPLETARSLVHDNIVHGGSWEDIVLVADSSRLPSSVRDLLDPPPADEAAALRHELDLVTGSLIWRTSAPLRRLRARLGSRHRH